MKHLRKRDEFLKNFSNIVTEREKYIPNGVKKINEDAGPFVNDIGWGDSLLGRLINSTIRKIKIGANLVRMKAVESRLREAMDELLLTSGIAELDPEDKSLYAKCLISTYLIMLEEGVKKGLAKSELMNLTDAAIDATEKEEVLEGKNELLRQLNEWKKYLDSFKEEEGQKEGQGDQEEGEDQNENVDPTSIYLENFSALFKMILLYEGIEKEKAEHYKNMASGVVPKATTTPAGTKAPSNGTSGVGTGTGTAGPGEGGNTQQEEEKKVTNQNSSYKYGLLKYDEFLKETVAGTTGKITGKVWKFFTGGKDEKALDPETKKLWSVIKPLYQMFGAEKGTLSRDGDIATLLKDPKSSKDYNKYKSNIDKIYSEIKSANGINEGAHELLGKYEQMGKVIAGIYAVTKTKSDGSFMQYPGTIGSIWDELTDNIAKFNSSMSKILSMKSKWNVGDIVKYKSDSTGEEIQKEIIRIEGKKLVFKDKKGEEYTKFMSEVENVKESMLIFEADETITQGQSNTEDKTSDTEDKTSDTEDKTSDEDGTVTGWKNPSSIGKIQDWWGKNMDLKQWMVEKTQVEKIRINLDKKLATQKDSVVIQSMDPVLEIVKIFNRAYKLHTTQVIPTGRSNGKVSNKTFLEYHCFGNGSPANAGEQGGPYRNIAIFNQWEDCVNDVLKDTKYQKIFNVGTRLKNGNDYIEKAGANLRKFMNDMLDGEELYKHGAGTDSQGAQAKFLDKYFGYKAEKDEKDFYYDNSDRDATGLAAQVSKGAMKPINTTKGVKYDKPEDLKGTFFYLRPTGGTSEKDGYYCLIQNVKDNTLFITISKSAGIINTISKQSTGTNLDWTQATSINVKDHLSLQKAVVYTFKVDLKNLLNDDGAFTPTNFDWKLYSKVKERSSNSDDDDDDSNDGKLVIDKVQVPTDLGKFKMEWFVDISKSANPDEYQRCRFKNRFDTSVDYVQNSTVKKMFRMEDLSKISEETKK